MTQLLNINQLCSVKAPLHAAYDYLVAAMNEQDPEEKRKLQDLMINRIIHAAENAGIEIRTSMEKAA